MDNLPLVIASGNQGKIREFKKLLDDFPFDLLTQPVGFEIEETGNTFMENARIKAIAVSQATGTLSLADDSGLSVEALGGAPGIYSSRWTDGTNNFDVAINRVFKEMNNIKKDWKNDNQAKFVCSMTIFWPNGKSFSSEGAINGKISTNKKGENGFGYDPIFIPDGFNETFGEMESKLKMSIDHRFKAYQKIQKFFS